MKYKKWSDLKNDKEQQAIYEENAAFVGNLLSNKNRINKLNRDKLTGRFIKKMSYEK